jgi:hypothetical protein
MRRVLLIAVIAIALSAGTALHAQIAQPNGVPAFHSCCAVGMFGPSVPAGNIGVRSGISGGAPRAFPVTREFRHDGFRHDGQHRMHRHRQFGNSGFPIYYAPYGYYDDTTSVDSNAPANDYEQPVNNDEAPGLTVFERRRTYDLIGDKNQRANDDRYGEHYTDSREQRGANPSEEREPKSTPSESQKSPEEPVSTILIFRDGSHREVHNYALMGNSIYDLGVKPGQGRMKILLADLDIPATVAANDQRGIEFKLPKEVSSTQ